jgi:Transposase zinc-binding domain
MTAIEICRTAALGGHVDRCQDCAHTRVSYNSCRNRNCPKCQWATAAAWLAAREAELLPVRYCHLVFTVPRAIVAIAYQNKAKVYGLLLKAAAETLTTVAANSRHLGAEIGVTAVLHTWGHALYCPGWGHFAGRQTLDRLQARIFSSRSGALARVPELVSRGSDGRIRSW